MKDSTMIGIVSFCVLMENHEGIEGKAPSYIAEKFPVIRSPLDMYCKLDSGNQAKVLEWSRLWKVDVEAIVDEMRRDYMDMPSNDYHEKYYIGSMEGL